MTTYYVRSVGGSDANSGTSFANGWATIQKALDECNGGVIADNDHVIIASDADYVLTAALATKSVRMVNIWGGDATGNVTGARPRITATASVNRLLQIDHNNHRFNFLDFDANGFATNAVYPGNFVGWLTYCRFRNATGVGWNQYSAGNQGTYRFFGCEFDNNGSNGGNLRNAIAERCSFHDNGNLGLEGNFLTLVDSWIYDNTSSGIGEVSGSRINGNVFDGNGGHGLIFAYSAASSSVIESNIFTRNSSYGVGVLGGTTHAVVANNVFGSGSMQNTMGTVQTHATVIEYLSQSGDPLYINGAGSPRNYNYQQGSPVADLFSPNAGRFIGGGYAEASGGGGAGVYNPFRSRVFGA